jgi:hypothetical protein
MDLELKTSCGTTVTLTCELPDMVRFECFVPEHGVCIAHVDPRGEEVEVLEVREVLDPPIGESRLPDDVCSHPAVIEQAGDVCAVFERALDSVRVWEDETLRAIADMAHLESDLHTAWCRLPGVVRDEVVEPYQGKAPEALEAFITEVLVPRAQDMAEAAAKRRQAQWEEEISRERGWVDSLNQKHAVILAAIKRAKEEGP